MLLILAFYLVLIYFNLFDCTGVFRGVSTDHWVLLEIDDLPADGAAFIGKPVDGGRCNLFRPKDSSGGGVDWRQSLIPGFGQSMLLFPFPLPLGQYSSGIDLVDANAMVSDEHIAKVAGHSHQAAF